MQLNWINKSKDGFYCSECETLINGAKVKASIYDSKLGGLCVDVTLRLPGTYKDIEIPVMPKTIDDELSAEGKFIDDNNAKRAAKSLIDALERWISSKPNNLRITLG